MENIIEVSEQESLPPIDPGNEDSERFYEWLRGRSGYYRAGQGWIRQQTAAQRAWMAAYVPARREYQRELREAERQARRRALRGEV